MSEFKNAYPGALSVGMQQRVGIARALVNDPDVLLLDEPFASLDALTSVRMRDLLLELWMEKPRTVVFVTHDVDEAILLSDRVLLLSSRPGRVEEEFYVDLKRPRVRESAGDPAYMRLKLAITDAILARSR